MKINKVFFKAKIIKRKDLQEHPEKYTHVLCLEVDPDWWYAVVHYGKLNKDSLDKVAVKIENWEAGFSRQAQNFYFEVRDRLAEAMGDTSREHKNHLHKEAKKECGLYDEYGFLKSLFNLNKRELWLLTELMLRWAEEAGAYVEDLIPIYRSMGRG